MNCSEVHHLLHGYVDRELDLVRHVQIEEHLQTCPACTHLYEQQQAVRTALRNPALYHKAPEGLRQRLAAEARREEQRRAPASGWSFRRWTPALAMAACVLAIALLLVRFLPSRFQDDRMGQEVVADHVRSLLVSHLADVVSTSQHTVKPWFAGKLNYAPPVQDLADQGYPLYGGRLDYLDNRPVAALVYRRRKHFINLFVWPSSATQTEAPPRAEERQGYHLLHWEHAGMTYWAVSDVNPADLQTFARLLSR